MVIVVTVVLRVILLLLHTILTMDAEDVDLPEVVDHVDRTPLHQDIVLLDADLVITNFGCMLSKLNMTTFIQWKTITSKI